MPRDDKDWKRLIRERMSRTGETYSTARANLLVEQPVEAKSIPEVRDLLALAHDLPSSITRLHVKTEQIWGRGALAIGEEEQRALGRVSVPRGERGRPRWHGETWMELDSRSWLDAMRTVLPVRWREEGVGERRRAAMLSGTYASNGTMHWSDTEHGLVSRPLDRRGATRPANGGWVCDTSWASVPGPIEIEDLGERVGRPVATVVLIPLGYEPFREPNRIPGPLDQGDQHRFAIDLETGLALKRTSYYKGEVILEREVLELDFPEFFEDSLFEPPSGREVQEVEGPRQYRDLDELLRVAPFRLLLPRLPERFRFLMGHVSPGPGDALRVALIFHAGPGESVVLNEVRDEVPDDMIPIAWARVERAGRVVEVSSLDPTVGAHDVRVVVDGIRARVVLSSLPLEDLVEVALSLQFVEGSGEGGG